MPDITGLVSSFLQHWETDYSEVEGNRTYAVHGHAQELRATGVDQNDIYNASTIAESIVRQLITADRS